MLMQIINFLILLWLVNRFLVKPLGAYLDKRKALIQGDIHQAEENKRQSEALLNEQKELLQTARVEAKQIRETTEVAMQKERQTVLSETKEESERMINLAKKEIGLDFVRAKKQLISDVGALTVRLSERLLRREFSDADKKRLVSESMETLKQQ